MGLFGSSLEKRLEKEIVPVFLMMGESPGQAQSSFAKLLRDVKAEAARAGTLNAPENGGDIILQRERTDENTRAALAKDKRRINFAMIGSIIGRFFRVNSR